MTLAESKGNRPILICTDFVAVTYNHTSDSRLRQLFVIKGLVEDTSNEK